MYVTRYLFSYHKLLLKQTHKLFFLTFTQLMIISVYSQNPSVELSQKFLESVKLNQASDSWLEAIEKKAFDELRSDLDEDHEKLAFWINLYNATTQKTLKEHPEYFKDRGSFYHKKLITVAGEAFSLDEIEHGILRRNTSKYSLGYFRKISTRKAIKKLMLKRIDPRIHYALNCGAKSCPPVMFYDDQKLSEQLDLSSRAYLETECEQKDGKLYVPALFSWFRGDFGGKRGIYRFLKKYGVIEAGEKPSLVFKEYDWTLSLGHYQ
ncbi:MAG: DUF547 domain-containing protein [Bacteroidetes bacterium]|nr:MAG: DUF547 domain-containing protein [Bacteroidota bacterium]